MMIMAKLFFVLQILFVLPNLFCAHKKYVFDVSLQFKSPDCVERLVALINGQFPGPMLNVSSGELFEVEVKIFCLY